jgi:hypothetical protein
MNNNNADDLVELNSFEMPPNNFPAIKSPVGPPPQKLSFVKSLNNVSIKLYKNKNYMHDNNLTKFEKSQIQKAVA